MMQPRQALRGGDRSLAVIGAGYVGLPTAAALASFGHRVVCAESNAERYETLRRGEIPIVEPGLAEMIKEVVNAGRLRFVKSASEAVNGAEFVFLCVPTPQCSDGSADLSFIKDVALEIANHLQPQAIVVNKSTVPVGSAMLVEKTIGRSDIRVVSNPEFLREGSAVRDSLNPDRVVVGADDHEAAARVGELFSQTGSPVIVTDTTTSETIKYASNAFLATKLSFVNSIAVFCEAVGADVRDVILGLGYDKRIGFEFLRPGPGWGGSCLPKDTKALLHISEMAGYDFALLRGAIYTNDQQLEWMVAKANSALGGKVGGSSIGVWGLTFKANTDDRRNSPALDIVNRLLEMGADIKAYDPTVLAERMVPTAPTANGADGLDREPDRPAGRAGPKDLAGITVCEDPYEAATGTSLLLVLTEWDAFRWLDFTRVHDLMKVPSIVDARNLLDPTALRRIGFLYTGVGRR